MTKQEFYQRLSNLTSTFQATCLVTAYEQTQRHYHTIEHLLYVLNEAERLHWLDDELFLAIAYHDYVYDPKSKTNEEEYHPRFGRVFMSRIAHLLQSPQNRFITSADPSISPWLPPRKQTRPQRKLMARPFSSAGRTAP